ncbi:MAG: SAM-dependent methyltransferase, partial [Mesorhizobium sp.]
MNILLKRILDRLVRTGNLKVTGPKGLSVIFGDGTGDPVHMHIKTAHAERAITFDPMLAVPEAYMDGELDILEGGVLGVMRIAFQNMGSGGI